MPRPSAFTRTGFLRCSSEPSAHQRVYDAMCAGLAGAYDLTPGTVEEARVYATSAGIARAAVKLGEAGDQILPTRVTDLLPVLERDWGIIPRPGATVDERRRELAAKYRMPRGAKSANVETVLATMLGDAFVAYRPTPTVDAEAWPATMADAAAASNLSPPGQPGATVRLAVPVFGIGDQTVLYTAENPADVPPSFYVGQSLLVDGGTPRAERVTVVGCVVSQLQRAGAIRATFVRAHDVGAAVTTRPFPMWTSTRRYALVVVTEAAAIDPATRGRIHLAMAALARGVSQWAIVPGAIGGTIGPFTLGDATNGRLSLTTIGAVSV